jgi:hypothetical protein
MDDKKAQELHDTMQQVAADIAKESKRYYEENLRNEQDVEEKIEGS